jgi:hypothetical protein
MKKKYYWIIGIIALFVFMIWFIGWLASQPKECGPPLSQSITLSFDNYMAKEGEPIRATISSIGRGSCDKEKASIFLYQLNKSVAECIINGNSCSVVISSPKNGIYDYAPYIDFNRDGLINEGEFTIGESQRLYVGCENAFLGIDFPDSIIANQNITVNVKVADKEGKTYDVCDGEKVLIVSEKKPGSLEEYDIIGGCLLSKTNCSISFNTPQTPGKYQYVAFIDINNNGLIDSSENGVVHPVEVLP